MVSRQYRHNFVTRLTHWINALALLILIMSGLQIFNAYPNLHWGHTSEPEEAFFTISATEEAGEIIGYVRFYNWSVNTTGFLGIQNTPEGPFPRAFPSWLTIPGFFWLAGGRRWHFFFAWVFVLNGLFYFVYNLITGHLRKFMPASQFQLMGYSAWQKIIYLGVFLILTPVVIVSGLAMSPQLNVAYHWLPELFGGRQSARSIHFLATLVFALFTFGHVFMVLVSGFVNNMRSMITGWYAQEVRYAQRAPVRADAPTEESKEPAVLPFKEDEKNEEP
ncbi:MAG: hypothetical protein GTO40_12110 [Deltaproteobacteria bacterium]|nr:hypothetical protein [Deltaproteobacteria bacterium]